MNFFHRRILYLQFVMCKWTLTIFPFTATGSWITRHTKLPAGTVFSGTLTSTSATRLETSEHLFPITNFVSIIIYKCYIVLLINNYSRVFHSLFITAPHQFRARHKALNTKLYFLYMPLKLGVGDRCSYRVVEIF